MSNENRPVGSDGNASMSPRSSQTTNVLPSRIRIDLAGHRQPLRFPMVRADDWIFRLVGGGKRRWNRTRSPGSPAIVELAPKRGGHSVGSTRGEIVEQASPRPDDAVGVRIGLRDLDGSAAHLDEPVLRPAPSRSMSTRSVPLVRSSSGTEPRWARSSKNADVASAIHNPLAQTSSCPSWGRPGARGVRERPLGGPGQRPPSAGDSSIPRFRCRYSLIHMASGVINAALRSGIVSGGEPPPSLLANDPRLSRLRRGCPHECCGEATA